MELTRDYIKGEYERYNSLYNEWYYKYSEKKKELETVTRETEEANKYLKEFEEQRNMFEKMLDEINSPEKEKRPIHPFGLFNR